MSDKKEPSYQSPAQAPARTQQQQQMLYQDQKVLACRPSRDGDPGYQLTSVESQVTIILEDGTEKVVRSSEVKTAEQIASEAKEAKANEAKTKA